MCRLRETEPMILRLAEKTWAASRKESRIARTVVLKLKTSEFNILTRSHTPLAPPSSCEELTAIALYLARASEPGPTATFSPGRRWVEQLPRARRNARATSPLRVKRATYSKFGKPGGAPQIPPLRYAPVGMTILFGNAKCSFQDNCHPDRSVPGIPATRHDKAECGLP